MGSWFQNAQMQQIFIENVYGGNYEGYNQALPPTGQWVVWKNYNKNTLKTKTKIYM